MTKLDERVSLEIEQELKALFDESAACEIPNHETRTEVHDGDGEWYLIYYTCVACWGPDDTECLLICDKFKRYLDENKETIHIPCAGGCNDDLRVSEILIGFEKKG